MSPVTTGADPQRNAAKMGYRVEACSRRAGPGGRLDASLGATPPTASKNHRHSARNTGGATATIKRVKAGRVVFTCRPSTLLLGSRQRPQPHSALVAAC